VSFDRAALNGTPIRAARFDTRDLQPGEAVTVVGLGGDSRLRSLATTVASIDAASFALSRTLQFRDSNIELVSLVNAPSEFDGVVVGRRGEVRALWSSFPVESARETIQINRGIPADLAAELVGVVRSNSSLYSLEVDMQVVPLSAARKLGLPDDWVGRLEDHSPQRRQALSISRVVAGSPASKFLRAGDLLLAVNGKVVNRFREVEQATQSPQVSVTVLRDGKQETLLVETVPLAGRDIDRLLLWAGAVLHAPHRAMASQRSIPPEGVFVAFFSYGSPSTRYQLFAGRRIVEVDGQPTPDLDAFIAAVRGRPDRSAMRLKTVTWNGTTEVITLKLDNHYWPAYELRRGPTGWDRRPIG
jgi:S1-C subfamily serine protease